MHRDLKGCNRARDLLGTQCPGWIAARHLPAQCLSASDRERRVAEGRARRGP
jgi:hypothetical protein